VSSVGITEKSTDGITNNETRNHWVGMLAFQPVKQNGRGSGGFAWWCLGLAGGYPVVSTWSSTGVVAGGRNEFWLPVRWVDPDLPLRPVGVWLDLGVMVMAKQHQVVQGGRPSGLPRFDVVRLTTGGRSLTTREHASAVPDDECVTDRFGDQPVRPADIQNLRLGTEHDRDDIRVTAQQP
jgi:hypothetical protein